VENLKKIVSNQYFPAAAVLTAVVLFWTIGIFGGLSLLHNNQPPMATLAWMLFVYAAAVLTPLAGIIAAADLIRRWRRNRLYAQAEMADYESAGYESVEYGWTESEAAESEWTESESIHGTADPDAARQATPQRPDREQPAQERPATHQPAKQRTQPKQGKKAA
jgi:hypothetical protein